MTDDTTKRGRGRPRLAQPTTATDRARTARQGTLARRVYLDDVEDERARRLMVRDGHASLSSLVEAAVDGLAHKPD